MADSKITALTSIGTITDPAVDPLVIVDVSDTSMAATGTTKKVTLNNLLACSPTATLASATITGALTAGTDITITNGKFATSASGQTVGLQLDSFVSGGAFNNYILNNASAAGTLASINFGRLTSLLYGFIRTNNSSQNLQLGTSGATGSVEFLLNNSTAMTLNSTGLGVGGSPASKLYVYGANVSGIGQFRIDCPAAGVAQQTFAINGVAQGQVYADGTQFVIGSATSTPLLLRTANTVAVTIDASQNVGVGVTPSATDSTYYQSLEITRVGQGLTGAKNALTSSPNSWLSNNSYATYSAGVVWKYAVSQPAAQYRLVDASHQWYTAPSGTAGNAITFTQAMTLDASGNLLVGTTSNAPAGTQSQFVNQWSGGAKWGSTFNQTVSSATAYTHIAFCTNGAVRGSIDANNTTITYGTVSDYRLKENVQPISNALTRIAALKPSTYKWKDSGTDGEGFIAHELAAVVPLAVVGQKDAVNEDGSIKAQQIDLSKVVPILVAAIQELTARVQTLEAK